MINFIIEHLYNFMNYFSASWYHWNQWLLLTVLLGTLLFGVDDLIIDCLAYLKSLFPKKISEKEKHELLTKPEKKMAIMIPAWDEGEVIFATLRGNVKQINYSNYHIYVGVYPNDPTTIEFAKKAQKLYPQVIPVINTKPGPTSKGQMLNLMVRYILDEEKKSKEPYAGILMQDAEDSIHPLILKLGNDALEKADFVQTPVFSLPINLWQLTGGTYKDEFAESHTKDLLVRSRLQAGVPSAGVGTFLGRNLCESYIKQNLDLFPEDSLTEDYELGLNSSFKGFNSTFICAYYMKEKNQKEFIATREYFPKKMGAAIRQKTRWNAGIILQGWERIGWQKGFVKNLFLWRDRKGILTHFLTFLGYFTLLSTMLYEIAFPKQSIEMLLSIKYIDIILYLCFFMGLNRFIQRLICTYRVYGLMTTLFIPVRWPVAVIVNFCSIIKAIGRYTRSKLLSQKMKWGKTTHEIPVEFLEEKK